MQIKLSPLCYVSMFLVIIIVNKNLQKMKKKPAKKVDVKAHLDKVSTEKKLKTEVTQSKKQVQFLIDERDRLQKELAASLEIKKGIRPFTINHVICKKDSEAVAVVLASDWHSEEEVRASANAQVTGLEGTGETGSVTIVTKANVYLIGVVGTGQLGETDESGAANVPVIGVEGDSELGQITTKTVNFIPVTLQQATGSIGNVVVRIPKGVSVTGVQGQGRVGKVLIWSKINPNQNPNWQQINDVQTPNWLPIAA